MTLDNLTGQPLGNPPFTLGWSFGVINPLTVTDLGLFDSSQNGLVDQYLVGLWDSSQNLLASAIIPSGTGATLVDQFRYVSISPTTLLAGQTYFIGALFTTGNDPLIFPGTAINFATSSDIAFQSARFAAGGSLTFPGDSSDGAAYFGPNFQYTAVPEPATLLLLGAGLSAAAARRRLSRRT